MRTRPSLPIVPLIVVGALLVNGLFLSPPVHLASTCSPADEDAWPALDKALKRLPNGGVMTLNAGACYRIEKTLEVMKRNNITIEGNGATLQAFTLGDGTPPRPGAPPSNRNRSHIRITQANGVTIRNLTIIGPNATGGQDPNLEAQHGFEIVGSTNVLIENATVRNTYGDGVYISKAPPSVAAANVTVKDSTIQTVGRHGIGVTFGNQISLLNNVLDGVARSAFDIEPSTTAFEIHGVTIDGNLVSNVGNAFVASHGSGCLVDNIVITNNEVYAGSISVMSNVTCHRHDVLVENNVAVMAPDDLSVGSWANFFRVDDVTVRNNEVTMARPEPGVTFSTAFGILEVTGNAFCGASDDVVALGSGPVTVADNEIEC